MRPAQAFRVPDIPVITLGFDTKNSAQIVWDNFRREVDNALPEPGNVVNDLRLEDINGSVGKVPGRVFDLLVEGDNTVLFIQFENAAGAGVVGSKSQHGHHMARRTAAMSRDEGADVEISQIVGMSDEEGVAPEPVPVGQHGASGSEQLVLVDEIDAGMPGRIGGVAADLVREIMRIQKRS